MNASIRSFARLSGLPILSLAMLALATPARADVTPDIPPAKLAACGDLARLQLPDTTMTSAVAVTTNDPALPGIDAAAHPFCRVVAHVHAAPDSDVAVEVWLPLGGWTGVFHGNGNGGFAGVLAGGYGSMKAGLERGFATATTDTGTAPATPLDGDALTGHPQKWRDWGRLSTHAMTVTGKAVAAAFYGRKPERSFYTGCSTGGQQGLIEALYYPADYDGILVGAPVVNRTWGHAAVLWDFAAAHRTPDSLLSEAKLHLLNKAAIAACNAGETGPQSAAFVADPFACMFDPVVLACAGSAADTCLTAAEVTTARAFYRGPSTRDGRPLFYGWLPGSEVPGRFGWSFLQTPVNGQPAFGGLFKWVFGKDWDWRTFDVDRDMPKVDAALGGVVNDAAHGSLKEFDARGGKLIIYHGLADTLVPPAQSVAFYREHAHELGGGADRTMRLFLVPGVMHCGTGPGPDVFNSALGGLPRPPSADAEHDLFASLIGWTDQGKAPDHIVATKYAGPSSQVVAFQRRLCAYPAHAGKTDATACLR